MEIIEEVIDDIIIEIINFDRATIQEAEELKNNVNEKNRQGYKKIVIDLSTVEFLDSTYLGEIVNVLKKVAKLGGDLKLVGFKPVVRSMFELTRLFRVFESYSELQDAIKSFHN